MVSKNSKAAKKNKTATADTSPVSSPDLPAAEGPKTRRAWALWLGLGLLLLSLLAAGVWKYRQLHSGQPASAIQVSAVLADEQQCSACHQPESSAWKGSHHHLAMQVATSATVLGNFDDARFTGRGESAHFFKKDGKFWIETEGADGKPAVFEATHTFGVEPLQQYLLALPGGKLQAFTVVWDTEKKKWFSLHPDEKIDYRDELHWTKPAQNWNFMCAECHTTGLKRNYDVESDSYKTQWHALGVGCQSCHGPASQHLDWAKQNQKKDGKGSGFFAHLQQADSPAVIETCGRCHSRRAPLGDGYVHGRRLSDDYAVSLLSENLYHVDGKIKDEVFEYGSFVQSKMFMKGLNCVDCHDPHSGKTRLPDNRLCVSCHNASAPAARPGVDVSGLKKKNYDSTEHHGHTPGAKGSACVDCHMPGKFYMGNDFRHDHSFSIPRPDLSRELGSPNACNQCHQEKTPEWAAGKIRGWHGAAARPKFFGELLKVLREGGTAASTSLPLLMEDKNLPAIQRATALLEAGRYPGASAQRAVSAGLKDAEPLLRQSALQSLSVFPPEQQIALAAPLLRDPVRGVRLTAAWQLNALSANLGTYADDWQKAIAEYEAAQHELADRAESHASLAMLYRQRGQTAQAWQAMEKALRLNPDFSPMIVMKSEMLDEQGDHHGAGNLLRAAIVRRPQGAELHHALGLALIRAGQLPEAVSELKHAAQLAPQVSSYSYVYAVALHDSGDRKGAIRQLEAVIKRDGSNRAAYMAAMAYYQEAGDIAGVQAMAQRLLEINPDDPSLRRGSGK